MTKVEKYTRDAEILRREVDRTPNDARHTFYLANSYRDSQQFDLALEFYARRVELGGWKEEVYYSLYMMGYILLQKGDVVKATRHCLKAFRLCPERAEALHILVLYHIMHSKMFGLAWSYNEKIVHLPLPTHHSLFIESDIYTVRAARHTQVLGLLCFRHDVEYTDGDLVELSKIETLSSYCPSTRLSSYPFPVERIPKTTAREIHGHRRYRVFNPSVAHHPDGSTMVVVRTSNYNDRYESCDDDGCLRTVNFLCTPDMDRVYILVDESSFGKTLMKKMSERKASGYEDMRLFFWADRWCFLANTAGSSEKIVFGKCAAHPRDDKEWVIDYTVQLRYAFEQPTEKNWVPCPSHSRTTFDIVYSTSPFVLLTVDPLLGFACEKKRGQWSAPRLSHYPTTVIPRIRNSTPYIPLRNGWIALCHVVYFLHEYANQRIYYHVFVFFDESTLTVTYSRPFHFETCNIEYTTGIVHVNSELTVSYSTDDKTPKCLVISEDEVMSLFEGMTRKTI
jgi:hypothetical protein